VHTRRPSRARQRRESDRRADIYKKTGSKKVTMTQRVDPDIELARLYTKNLNLIPALLAATYFELSDGSLPLHSCIAHASVSIRFKSR
jgi:hypothetical protein